MDDLELIEDAIEKAVEDNTIDYEWILSKEIKDTLTEFAEAVDEFIENFKKALSETAEALGEALDGLKDAMIKATNRPKYKPVKSLIKPYKQPFIKVRYRARANL